LGANPPHGLTSSNSPYTDEGFYSTAARNFAMFGAFGNLGRFSQLINPGYTAVEAVLFKITGPSFVAARALSMIATCGMILIVLWGLAKPLGRLAAALVAAGLAGCQLILLYGHVGIVEPFELMLVVGGFVAMTRAMAGESVRAGVLCGALLAGALSAKASAALTFPAILGVPAVVSAVTAVRNRTWQKLYVPLAATATLAGVVAIWILAILVPNWSQTQQGWKVLEDGQLSSYPSTVQGGLSRFYEWFAYPARTDHVLTWTTPLLIGAVVGSAALIGLWRRASHQDRWVTASGWIWVLTAWTVPILGAYTPNRFFLIGVPGLALAAAPGLAVGLRTVAEKLGRPAAAAGTAAVLMGLVLPGVLSYSVMESGVFGTNQLGRDEAAVARYLTPSAVVYGQYAPDLSLPTRAKIVIPAPHSGLHMTAPVERYGVNYLIADVPGHRDKIDNAVIAAVISPGHPLGEPIVTVPWGPHELGLYRLAPNRTR
jgi:4-amino-4-deoxy-L-arabinose transferase-like glycosyltransferase